MTDSLGGILTNGVGGDFNALILGPFRLNITVGEPPDFTTKAGGAHADFDRFRDEIYKDEEPKKLVFISVKMGDTIIEKRYVVSKQRSDKIVTVVKWLNKTLFDMKIRVIKFKKKMGTITVNFKRNDK